MVADQNVDPPSGPNGLPFELHQQIHHLSGFIAPVQKVAGLHEVGAAAAPVPFPVCDPSVLQKAEEMCIIPVDVTHGDDAPDIRPDILRLFGKCGGSDGKQEPEDEGAAANQ
jgi:hypothetical protein